MRPLGMVHNLFLSHRPLSLLDPSMDPRALPSLTSVSRVLNSVITPAEHQDDFSASAAPVAETAAPSAKAAVGLPSKRKRCGPAAETRERTTRFQRGNKSDGLSLNPERRRRGRPGSETTGDETAPSAR
jgi:hypothetical protein